MNVGPITKESCEKDSSVIVGNHMGIHRDQVNKNLCRKEKRRCREIGKHCDGASRCGGTLIESKYHLWVPMATALDYPKLRLVMGSQYVNKGGSNVPIPKIAPAERKKP
ncbi:hypothetical protein J6590_064642 [Homalodisca vitripennis]|nr:hypothetical protein J6590_064642 [Homalodisca vitripennis]